VNANTGHTTAREPEEHAQIRRLSSRLSQSGDLDPLTRVASGTRYICVGGASHGTREYYRWRAAISRRLIEEHGVSWIGVEGDWPDCWRINTWVRGQRDRDLDAHQMLDRFQRWPTWTCLPSALRAWQCFVPFGEDPQRYARGNRLVPQSCETDVIGLRADVHRQTPGRLHTPPRV
jgi:hypothetical protein